MRDPTVTRRSGTFAPAALLAVGLAVIAQASPALGDSPSAAGSNRYVQTNLVSDIAGRAELLGPDLVDPWGMATGPTSPVWVSDFGNGKVTLYGGHVSGSPVTKAALVVTIPGSAPTGQVFNTSVTDWLLDGSHRALFIFASTSGTISGWSPSLGTSAVTKVLEATAVFTGLAISTGSAGHYLYAADFAQGTISVFDGSFAPATLPGSFTDPLLPAGFAPFNIQAIGSRLYVTYAEYGISGLVPGPHLGFVDVFHFDGTFVKRLASGGTLNAPWGLVRAPSGFGAFSGDILVGNTGNGRISAFDPATGHYEGQLHRKDGTILHIPGLQGLLFGNGNAATAKSLLFTAGIAGGTHGLLGAIETK